MAEERSEGLIIAALLDELARQGFGASGDDLDAYPVHGSLDLRALADAIGNALGGGIVEDAKSPGELNAANDG